jgi:hypothetical protein
MYISDKVVFVELQKTATTHIKHILLEALDGESVGKHNQLTPELVARTATFLGSVRNPYDWYLSLWGYGCDSKGGVFHRTTRMTDSSLRGLGWRTHPGKAISLALKNVFNRRELTKRRKEWLASYGDVNNPVLFRDWLRMIHDSDYFADVGEGYSCWPGSSIAGLMTFRYLNLFCVTTSDKARLGYLNSVDSIIKFESKNLKINRFVRQESLESDMSEFLKEIGVGTSLRVNEMLSSKTNTSSRGRDLHFYYDQESLGLIARREKMIIEKFGYCFPEQ